MKIGQNKYNILALPCQEFLLYNVTWENINEGTVIKLLMERKDAKHFDIRPARPESLRVPPK